MADKRDTQEPMPLSGQQPYQGQPRRGGNQRQGLGEAAIKSFIRAIAASLGRIIVRTITRRIR